MLSTVCSVYFLTQPVPPAQESHYPHQALIKKTQGLIQGGGSPGAAARSKEPEKPTEEKLGGR